MGLTSGLRRLVADTALLIEDAKKASLWQYCDLATADPLQPYSLVTNAGEYLTLIDIRGRLTQPDASSINTVKSILAGKLTGSMSGAAHAMQFVFTCDPSKSLEKAMSAVSPSKITARQLGLDVGGLLDDYAERVSKHTAHESVYLACWTTRDALGRAEQKRDNAERNEVDAAAPKGSSVQDLAAISPGLRSPHKQFIETVCTGLAATGLVAERLDAHDAAKVMREMVDPDRSQNWRAILPGDKLSIQEPEPSKAKRDQSWWMYPALNRQLFSRAAEEKSETELELAGYIHHPVMMTSPPQNPQSFTHIFNALVKRQMPWRISILVESDGMRGLTLRAFLASILWWSDNGTRLLNEAVNQVRDEIENNRVHVRLRVMADTWVKATDPHAKEKLHTQVDNLITDLEGWGITKLTDVMGDPTLGTSACIVGLKRTAPNIPACAPLKDAIHMLPLLRPVSLWESGTMLLRTPDGKLMPFQPGSSKQTASVSLYIAPPRRGKSVMMNTENLAFVLRPGLDQLPYLSGLDVGPSSSGQIEMIKASLPEHLRYLALYKRIRMTQNDAMNPCDLELGCIAPLPQHKSWLRNFFVLLGSDRNENGKYVEPAGLSGALERCIELAYDEYAPHRNPKRYSPHHNRFVHEAVQSAGLQWEENKTTWWTIVRGLVMRAVDDNGQLRRDGALYLHAASLAQRSAVPLLMEVGSLALRDEVRSIYGKVIAPTGETIPDYINRVIGIEAVNKYPILSCETQLDIGQARIISLDLDEVIEKGSGVATQQNGVVMMLAKHITTGKFFLSPDDVPSMPEWVQPYQERRIKALKALPKRFFVDEWHRFADLPGVLPDMEANIREAPKWNIDIALASQAVKDFSRNIVEFSTCRWVLGYGTTRGAEDIKEHLGLDEAAFQAVKRLPQKPTAKGSTLVAHLNTEVGTITQTVMVTIGSQMVWALSTTAEDMAIRNTLYERIGVSSTLQTLAKYHPGGTLKAEVEKRRLLAKGNDVIAELVDELADKALAA